MSGVVDPTFRVAPAATKPRQVKHGTLRAYNNGCRCGTCVALAQALGSRLAEQPSPVPFAAKPAKPRRRVGRGWTSHIEPAGTPITWPLQGATGTAVGPGYSLRDGLIACNWTGTTGVVLCTEETWKLIETDDAATTCLQLAQEEAKGAMPRAVVRDVAVYSALVGTVERPIHDPKKPKPGNGIEELSQQIQALVVEMARYVTPEVSVQAEFARRYGKLRDQVAALRTEFTEAEGAFEVAQARIIEFMEQD